MYAAISTRYVGPTNMRGSRVIADAGDGRRIIVDWNHGLNVENNHRTAALRLRDNLNWDGDMIGGWGEIAGKPAGFWVFVDGPYAPEPHDHLAHDSDGCPECVAIADAAINDR